MSEEPGERGTPRWSRYKLRGDPYFVDALEPDEDALYPITLFRGRDEELSTLKRLVRDNDRSATLVHARGGHGKTTLANRVAHDVADHGVLVTPEEIQLSAEAASFRFFRDVLSGILSALADAGHALPQPPPDPTGDKETGFPALLEARTLVRTIRRRAGRHGGGQALGVGGQGGVEHAFLQPTYEPGSSRTLLTNVAREIGEIGYSGVLVRVNNLDDVERSHPDVLDVFLGESRDLFKIPGIHYVFLGNADVLTRIESIPRVRGCFDLPIALEPFTEDEVLEILEARYNHLASEDDWIAPISDEVVRRLHRVHYGDLRNILADLGRCVQAVRNIEAEPIGVEDALPVLQDVYLSILGQRLGDELWETIEVIADEEGPVRQTDLQDVLNLSPPGINQRFQKLDEAGAIELSHRDGASKYFRLTSAARFALAGSIQKHAGQGGGADTFAADTQPADTSGDTEPPAVPDQLEDAYLERG